MFIPNYALSIHIAKSHQPLVRQTLVGQSLLDDLYKKKTPNA